MEEKITHEMIWGYLEKFAPYLSEEELSTFTELFALMGQDYTPIQLFGTDTLSFALEKEAKPYVAQGGFPFVAFPLGEEKTPAVQMLDTFRQAASHMETNELHCILTILSMIDQDNLTISLRASQDGTGTQVLDCYQKENITQFHRF